MCQIVVNIRDLNNDDLSMHIDKMVNNATPSASQQYEYETIPESAKTIKSTMSWQKVIFKVHLNYIGYSNIGYMWRLSVSDGIVTKTMKGQLK